jgi:hypothetical protein
MDLLRIKETLGQVPKAATVQAREDFIDNKFKRRLRRLTETTAATTAQAIQASALVVEQPAPVIVPTASATPATEEPAAPVVAQKKLIVPSTK